MATRGLILLAKDTFSGVSAVSFDNVFSNTYKQYKIIFNVIGSSASALAMRMRASGSNNASTNYNREYLIGVASSALANRDTSQTQWVSTGRADTFGSVSVMEILNPFQNTYTSASITMPSQANSTSIENVNIAFGLTVTTSYDGFTVFSITGGVTLSGTITVYGLAE